MADLDRMAIQISDGLRNTLSRVSALSLRAAAVTAVIGVATFITGLWVFGENRLAWVVIGGALCAIPIGAAYIAWFYVRCTVKVASVLGDEVRTLLSEPHGASQVLIDHDTGERLGTTAKSLTRLGQDLKDRRRELPALYLGVRAITTVPALAAIALLGSLAVGALGTILLIGKLIS